MASIPPTDRVASDFQVQPHDDEPEQQTTGSGSKLWDMIVKLVKGLMGWLSVILLMVVPPLAGYTVGYALAFAWAVAMETYLFYQWRFTGTVKVWPKILDVGIVILALILLIIEVTTHPNDEFHKAYSGIISNGGLAFIVLVSIIIRQPFTLQFAKEVIPQDKWDHPGTLFVSYATAWLWFGIFDLSVLSQCIPLMLNDKNTTDSTYLIFGTIVPLVILFLGFKASDELVKFLKKKGQERAAKQAAANV